jgi:excisionase family DNA binding protein
LPIEKLMTVTEALEALRISRSKLHQEVRSGQLKVVKIGRKTLFRASALQAYIEGHESRDEKAKLVRER